MEVIKQCVLIFKIALQENKYTQISEVNLSAFVYRTEDSNKLKEHKSYCH